MVRRRPERQEAWQLASLLAERMYGGELSILESRQVLLSGAFTIDSCVSLV
jgi:hypothetical protein